MKLAARPACLRARRAGARTRSWCCWATSTSRRKTATPSTRWACATPSTTRREEREHFQQAAGAGPVRQLPPVRAAGEELQLVGLPDAGLPEEPRPAHRPHPGERSRCEPQVKALRHRPRAAQVEAAQRPRAGDGGTLGSLGSPPSRGRQHSAWIRPRGTASRHPREGGSRRSREGGSRLHSSPSSWILRVMVLRPMPSFCAASMRRPRVLASAVRISCDSKRLRERVPHVVAAGGQQLQGLGFEAASQPARPAPAQPARQRRRLHGLAPPALPRPLRRAGGRRAPRHGFGRHAAPLRAAGPWARSAAPAPSRSASGRCSPAGARCPGSRRSAAAPAPRRRCAWAPRPAAWRSAAGSGASASGCPRGARAAPAGAGGSRSGGGTGLRGSTPSLTRCSRSWWVAAITRTLAFTALWPPTR